MSLVIACYFFARKEDADIFAGSLDYNKYLSFASLTEDQTHEEDFNSCFLASY